MIINTFIMVFFTLVDIMDFNENLQRLTINVKIKKCVLFSSIIPENKRIT